MLQDHPDLAILGLAGSDDNETVAAFVEQTGVTFPIAWDDGVLAAQVDWPQSISPYPRQLLIGADGRIVYVASEHRDSDLRAAIEAASN